MVEGAAKLLSTGIPNDGAFVRRLDGLLQESDSIYGFLRTCVERTSEKKAGITIDRLYHEYELWCLKNDWQPLPMRIASGKLRDGIMALYQVPQSHDLLHQGQASRGYHGLAFKTQCVLPDVPDTKNEQFAPDNAWDSSQADLGF